MKWRSGRRGTGHSGPVPRLDLLALELESEKRLERDLIGDIADGKAVTESQQAIRNCRKRQAVIEREMANS